VWWREGFGVDRGEKKPRKDVLVLLAIVLLVLLVIAVLIRVLIIVLLIIIIVVVVVVLVIAFPVFSSFLHTADNLFDRKIILLLKLLLSFER
jgi:hypothetical protein